MFNALHHKLKHAILTLLSLALFSLPFAHRAGAAPVTAEITQYMALGGSLSDICGNTAPHMAGGCESCRIVAAMLLPPAANGKSSDLAFTSVRREEAKPAVAIAPTSYASPPVRAPPAV